MIPPVIIALLSLATTLGLLREAKKKTQLYYRLRWACMSLPFFYQSVTYFWVAVTLPSADERTYVLRFGNFIIVLCASIYFTLDLYNDIKAKRSIKQ